MGQLKLKSASTCHKDFNARSPKNKKNRYSQFDLLDGQHPWQKVVPEGYILYPVRELNSGKVCYFNFKLAKEMGLIPMSHSNKMTDSLHKKLLKTFSIRIVNEYDEANNIHYHPSVMKKHPYMATRYLQLQHSDKTGRTSGDGRCIWNGCIEHNGVFWDVSSRGIGVTALSPGSVTAGQPLQSGNTDFGYGCGLADIDELVSSAILSESFYNNGFRTERMLCVVDIGQGAAIGVRAAQNLIRPAHLFMFLKQGQLDPLKRGTDYLIERQFKNSHWSFSSRSKDKYQLLLDETCDSFAYLSAQLDRNYIFTWLDWDGDNILADSGIIDYGSIRQFGLRHDQYRYDDVERFSTNLNEQVGKAKAILQTFAQMCDFLKKKKKKPLHNFSNHKILKQFDKKYKYYLHQIFLEQIGFDDIDNLALLESQFSEVKKLYKSFYTLESTKTVKKMAKVADGVNRPAIFNMKKGLLFLVQHYKEHDKKPNSKDFFKVILSQSAKGQDRNLNLKTETKIKKFIKNYDNLVSPYFQTKSIDEFEKRAESINWQGKVTGDGLVHVVDKILRAWKHGRPEPDFMQKAIENIISDQSPNHTPNHFIEKKILNITNTLLSLVDDFKESI